jgi:8-oxo-dGTP pyrophosphatase MutT (NUDIX family)
VGRTEYLNDPAAPKPNSLVPAAGVLAVDDARRVLLQRRRDTGQWAIPMGKQELGETSLSARSGRPPRRPASPSR